MSDNYKTLREAEEVAESSARRMGCCICVWKSRYGGWDVGRYTSDSLEGHHWDKVVAHFYPDTVPVLEGKDFCEGLMKDGQACLVGWALTTFLNDRDTNYYKQEDFGRVPGPVRVALLKSAHEVFEGRQASKSWYKEYLEEIDPDEGNGLFLYNDHGFMYGEELGRGPAPLEVERHKRALSRVWNRAMELLGYVDGHRVSR